MPFVRQLGVPAPRLEELGSDRLEIVRADMSSTADIERLSDGIEYVFHLATTDSKTWDQFVEREVEPARALARACLERGVKRLIYTGTIDSFYAGGRAGTITEDTPLDPQHQTPQQLCARQGGRRRRAD